MSTPIITLPIERVERHRDKERVGAEGYADDRPLAPALTKAVDQALGGRPLFRSPFYRDGAWRFASMPYTPGCNLSRQLPSPLSESLGDAGAVVRCRRMPAGQWAGCLRNALAHGGIAYLDADGQQSFGGPTEMIAFISAQYPDRDVGQLPTRLQALRISRDDYLDFLRRWVGWLRTSHLSSALAA
jgi:hypothetical protein